MRHQIILGRKFILETLSLEYLDLPEMYTVSRKQKAITGLTCSGKNAHLVMIKEKMVIMSLPGVVHESGTERLKASLFSLIFSCFLVPLFFSFTRLC